MTDTTPVILVSGYLGAGKTTLVNNLLRNAEGTRLAILVNEFGDLPIDEDLIETCLLYTSPSPRDAHESRMPSSA